MNSTVWPVGNVSDLCLGTENCAAPGSGMATWSAGEATLTVRDDGPHRLGEPLTLLNLSAASSRERGNCERDAHSKPKTSMHDAIPPNKKIAPANTIRDCGNPTITTHELYIHALFRCPVVFIGTAAIDLALLVRRQGSR